MPEKLVDKNIWKNRFRHIRQFEEYLSDQGTVVRKFFLHVSKKEQRRRFMERLDLPEKNWKFSTADVHEREHFGDYMDAYEDMIRHTSTKGSPWYVVPADHKWFTRLVVAAAVIDALETIKPSFPKLDDEKRRELTLARAALEAEPGARKEKADGGEAEKEKRVRPNRPHPHTFTNRKRGAAPTDWPAVVGGAVCGRRNEMYSPV